MFSLLSRVEWAARALPGLTAAVAPPELYQAAVAFLTHREGLGAAGAAVLRVRGEELAVELASFPMPGRSFRRDQDHRYARMARGALPREADDGECLVPLDPGTGPLGYLVLRFDEVDRAARAGPIALASLIGHTLAVRLRELEARAAEAAAFDDLTGLPLPAALERALAAELERARRYERPLSLALLVSPGEPAPDTARWLVGQLRAHDLVCRLRQDTFAVLLPETPLEHAQLKAEALREQADLRGRRLAIGLATRRWDTDRPEALLEQADGALGSALRQGDAVHVWQDGPVRIPPRLSTPLA